MYSQMGKFSLYAVIMQQHSLFESANGGESASLDVCSVNHRIIELLRLEGTSKIIKSNHSLTIVP